MIIIDRSTQKVRAIVSFKTSLRERLTETAFWKRELEKNLATKDVKIIFVTTDKDEELKNEVNRYIILQVLDYTVVTNSERYSDLINYYSQKYKNKEGFNIIFEKILPLNELKEVLERIK